VIFSTSSGNRSFFLQRNASISAATQKIADIEQLDVNDIRVLDDRTLITDENTSIFSLRRPSLMFSTPLNFEFEGTRFSLRSFGDTLISEVRTRLDHHIGECCSRDMFDIVMPDEVLLDDDMTLDDVGQVDFLKIVRRRPRFHMRRPRPERIASAPLRPPRVFFLYAGTERLVSCAVRPESTLPEIEFIVRRTCRLGDSPVQFLMRMRSDLKLSAVWLFPREKFGEFDLVFLCLPKHSSLSNPCELQNLSFDCDRYRMVDLIGRGSQGEVIRYQSRTSDELIAVKSSALSDGDITGGIVNEKVLREVRSLMKFRHPCIVPLLGYDVQIESKILRIVMPYIGPDSLESVLTSPENHPWLSFTSKTMIIVGIVAGMCKVHCGNIIHRDLKPTNILLDPISHCPIIVDFGLSREQDVNVTMTFDVGSPLYMAPELFIGEHYTNKVDVFSFGILLYEIVTGRRPLQDCGDNPFQLFTRVQNGSRAKIPDAIEPFTTRLINRCWDGDPDQRPTFLEIFNELREQRFKIFSAVDSRAVDRFLQSLR
jgi:hypothetical protein